MRKSYGAFKSVDDLLAIKGIGPKRLEKMRKYLTVGKAPQTKKPSTSAQSAPGRHRLLKRPPRNPRKKQLSPRTICEGMTKSRSGR